MNLCEVSESIRIGKKYANLSQLKSQIYEVFPESSPELRAPYFKSADFDFWILGQVIFRSKRADSIVSREAPSAANTAAEVIGPTFRPGPS